MCYAYVKIFHGVEYAVEIEKTIKAKNPNAYYGTQNQVMNVMKKLGPAS